MNNKMTEFDTDLIIKFTSALSKLDATMDSIRHELDNHEKRLSKLEDEKPSIKQDLVILLTKGLVIAVISIASLSGAAGIVSKIFGF